MNDQSLSAFLAAIPLPCLAIDASERIIGANPDALTLIGQQAKGQNYILVMMGRRTQRFGSVAAWCKGRAKAQQALCWFPLRK